MLNEERTLLAKRWPEMAAKIQKLLLSEGKITKEMIESYVDAYAGIYGDDTDAYVEEIVADTYAGMNRTDYGTNQLRADVKMEVGQWQKKSGSARAPPAKYSMVGRGENGLKTYKSDFGSDMTVEEKKTYMYRLITDVWAKKPLQLTILQDGKEQQVTARFDGEANGERFAGKMAYGNRRGNRTERLITLNLANDIWEIANESRYENSKGEFRQTRMHESSERWHYFVNAINYVDDAQPVRNGVYDFNLDVMERDDGDFVYTFSLKKRRTDAPRTFTAGVDGKNAADAGSSKNSISKTGETVKEKMSAQDGRVPFIIKCERATKLRRTYFFMQKRRRDNEIRVFEARGAADYRGYVRRGRKAGRNRKARRQVSSDYLPRARAGQDRRNGLSLSARV